MWVYLLLFFVPFTFINGLENGLARKPPMGWMHWQRYRCVTDCENYPNDCVHENLFMKMANLMVSEGYLEAGYNYIIVDDCWMAKERDSNGRLQSDPIRFPSGIKALADYVHEKGLKFGLYEDYGTHTCAGYPGIMDHMEIDAQTFADWEIDYLKLDGCFSDFNWEAGYAKFGELLNKTGRPIVYSCSWPAYEEPFGVQSNYEVLVKTCNLWRNWDDIDDTWHNVTRILHWFSQNQDRIAKYSGPGHWNDPDMLLLGNFGLSYEQSKAQMAIWAILAAPLIMSNNLADVDPKIQEILLNQEVIAINQDRMGIQGLLKLTKNKIDVWTKPIFPIINNETSYALAFLSNRVDGYPYKLSLKMDEIGLDHRQGYEVSNIFDPEEFFVVEYGDPFSVRVKPSGVVLLKAVPIFVLVKSINEL